MSAVAVCGPPKYSELRINLAQAFNGIGTVVAPVLGSYVFFVDVGEGSEALKNVQWVYLAIAIFVYVLAVVFYFATVSHFHTIQSRFTTYTTTDT
jgi:FHS family L-fucose permease-like MFS transporter